MCCVGNSESKVLSLEELGGRLGLGAGVLQRCRMLTSRNRAVPLTIPQDRLEWCWVGSEYCMVKDCAA